MLAHRRAATRRAPRGRRRPAPGPSSSGVSCSASPSQDLERAGRRAGGTGRAVRCCDVGAVAARRRIPPPRASSAPSRRRGSRAPRARPCRGSCRRAARRRERRAATPSEGHQRSRNGCGADWWKPICRVRQRSCQKSGSMAVGAASVSRRIVGSASSSADWRAVRRNLLAGNRVLLGHPRAEVDQPAALAAERPPLRRGGPFHRALARGARKRRHGRPARALAEACRSGAERRA